MKATVIALAFLFTATFAQAEIHCLSKDTQFKYVIDVQRGTLFEYDDQGQNIGIKKALKADMIFGETMPPKTITRMRNSAGTIEIEFTEMAGKITGEIDDDYSLVCVRRAVEK